MHGRRRRVLVIALTECLSLELAACRRACEPEERAIAHDPAPSHGIGPVASKPKVVDKVAERHGAVDVKLTWPLLDPGFGQAGVKMSTLLEDELRMEADEIEWQHADQVGKYDPDHAPGTWHPSWLDGWTLEVTCRATLVAQGLISVACSHTKEVGGAHGQQWTTSRVDLVEHDTLRPLTLRDILGEKGLENLAPSVAASLARQKAPDALGGDPGGKWLLTDDKLSAFCVDPAGLSFDFAPYVVGPYAAGGYFVRVDWKTLRAAADEPATIERLRAAANEEGASSASCGD